MTLPNLPPIGFGAMPLSIKGRPGEDTARRVLHAAIDLGTGRACRSAGRGTRG
ncbi:MAG TPA: hypothetical protein VMS98_00530 [Thermoanaerobaculia bacterium]|nr:hypothetical protein [Thermoanaerobaculia bacterium]